MITVSNNITLELTDLKQRQMLKWCEENLVINNPEFLTKQKLNLWLGDTPRKLYLFEIRGSKIILPFGCLADVFKILKGEKYALDFANDKVKITGDLTLYDYQEEAVSEVIKKKNGVLISPAGSGKTQMAIEIIKRLGLKTLWVTHTQDLLKQSKDRFETYFKAKTGTITAGKVDIGDITFATVQTLSKLDLREYEKEFSVVIVDECHRLSSSPTKMTMFGKVVNSLKSRYKIGLTATAHRSDGMIRSLFAYLGDVMHEVPFEAVENNIIKAEINIIETNFNIEEFGESFNTDGTINYTRMLSEIAESKERSNFIVEKLKENKGKSCLVLSDRLEQLKYIKDQLGYGVMVHGKMTSKKGKKEREQAIKNMQDGKEKVLFASYKLAKEGLDIKCLERLFLATPVKDKAVVIQSVGRIERKAQKSTPEVFDFVDNIGICRNMLKERKRIYKKNKNILK